MYAPYCAFLVVRPCYVSQVVCSMLCALFCASCVVRHILCDICPTLFVIQSTLLCAVFPTLCVLHCSSCIQCCVSLVVYPILCVRHCALCAVRPMSCSPCYVPLSCFVHHVSCVPFCSIFVPHCVSYNQRCCTPFPPHYVFYIVHPVSNVVCHALCILYCAFVVVHSVWYVPHHALLVVRPHYVHHDVHLSSYTPRCSWRQRGREGRIGGKEEGRRRDQEVGQRTSNSEGKKEMGGSRGERGGV